MKRIAHVGVDGCKFGWIAVFSDGAAPGYALFPNFACLAAHFSNASRIMVDIPLGLPWRACPVRPCDALARRHLGGGRASSVFPAPTRAACRASSIEEARRLNLEEIGRSLSAQSWGICPKVAEVDGYLLSHSKARSQVREVHPEICFWSLNGGAPMQHSKKTERGLAERLAVLRQHLPQSQSLLETVLRERLRREVQPDDVVDAIAAFITAAGRPDLIQSLQGQPACDANGLPMEMVYFRLRGRLRMKAA